MNDATSPATKGDLELLRKDLEQKMGGLRTDLEQKMTVMGQDLEQKMTVMGQDLEQKMTVMGQDLEQKMTALQQETLRHLALGFETFRHDFFSVHHDEIQMLTEKNVALDARVSRLERSTGLVAA